MNIFKWYRDRRKRYCKAMMMYWQDEYLHAVDSLDESNKYFEYLRWKAKYNRFA